MSCFVAHDAAYYDAKILHRDISAGNIMISEEGGGFLIDWDMCVRIGGGVQPSGRVERTVGVCLLFQDCLVDVSDILGNVAIHVSSSPPE